MNQNAVSSPIIVKMGKDGHKHRPPEHEEAYRIAEKHAFRAGMTGALAGSPGGPVGMLVGFFAGYVLGAHDKYDDEIRGI